MRTVRLVGIAIALFAAAGCERNDWGSRCEKDSDCGGSPLVCKQFGPEANPNVSGFCRYPEDALTCGPGTVLDGATCIVDPTAPPEVTCGPGTIEDVDHNRCDLAVDAAVEMPDSGVDGGAGVDAGVDAGVVPDAGVDAGV